jgi:hypothetical protein
MLLQVVLEVTKGLIKPVGKKVGDTQLLICGILQNDFVVQVLDPGPKNVGVIQRGKVETSFDVLQVLALYYKTDF